MDLPRWFWCYGSAATATGPIVDHQTVCRFCGLEVEVIDGLIAEHGAVKLWPRVAAVAAALALVALILPGHAEADPLPCATAGTCQYMPNPSHDGPLMPTWDTPGYYGGATTGPVQCNPFDYSCRGVVNQ